MRRAARQLDWERPIVDNPQPYAVRGSDWPASGSKSNKHAPKPNFSYPRNEECRSSSCD